MKKYRESQLTNSNGNEQSFAERNQLTIIVITAKTPDIL